VVLSSLALSSGLFFLTSGIHLDELRTVSKPLNSPWEIGSLLVWRAVEVGLAWLLGYDGRDVLSFIFLTHLPTYTLLSSFYKIRPTTILVAYAITLFSNTIPFVFFRRSASVHDLAHAPSSAVSNRNILQDRPTAIYTTIAATSIFTVALYVSYATWLPAQLVVHFQNIPDISLTHAGPAGLPVLFFSLLPAGWAAKDFLFVSSAGATSVSDSGSKESQSQQGEYLACALYRNTWGALPAKARVLTQRTITLATIIVASTIVQLVETIKGADVEGATAWGAVWAVATLAVGLTFGWIEAVDGV
jgi:hypothetical protein